MAAFNLEKSAYYYYNLLNENEKLIYKEIMKALLAQKPKAELSFSPPSETVSRVYTFLLNDRPDIFWLGTGYSIASRAGRVEYVSFEYRMSLPEIEETKKRMLNSRFFRELDSLILSAKSTFEKALAAYEYIIKHADYDVNAARSSDSKVYAYAYNMDGLILRSKGVCASYAKVFQYFMNRHGIYCTLVSGKTSRDRHAWNLINIGGSYYYVDATWGDPVFADGSSKPADFVSYDYFCITTEEMNRSHKAVLDVKMPLCNDTTYNYYRYFNMVSASFSVENLVSNIISAYRNGKKEAVVKYSSDSAYRTAVRELFDNDKIYDVLSRAKNTVKGLSSTSVRYSLDEGGRVIKIKLQ